jgi:predicted O-methyltransferase YrrM
MDAAQLDQLAAAYRPAAIFFAALRLGVFTALDSAPRSAAELAGELESDERGVRILCDALAALEILHKDGDGRYANAPVAAEVLLPDSPGSKRAMFLHGARQMAKWGGLYDCVRRGRPTPEDEIDPRLGGGAEAFAAAMADVGRESAGKVAEALDLSSVSRLLDVGGGPGVYAIELARRHPQLRVVIFDRPDTAPVARRNVAAAGLAGRIEARGGDAFADDLGGPYDLVLISNLVHIYPPQANRELVRRCAAALAPGGRLAVKDFLLDPGATSPRGAALFAVNMLVSTEAGDGYTAEQVAGWMGEAGLRPQPLLELTEQSRVLVGRRV